MKRILLIGFIALCWVGMQAQERIMVITDPHVLAPSLVEPGTAFDEMMTGQRKMIDLSAPVWEALMDTALLYKIGTHPRRPDQGRRVGEPCFGSCFFEDAA